MLICKTIPKKGEIPDRATCSPGWEEEGESKLKIIGKFKRRGRKICVRKRY